MPVLERWRCRDCILNKTSVQIKCREGCWASPWAKSPTSLEMSYWLGNGFCLSAVCFAAVQQLCVDFQTGPGNAGIPELSFVRQQLCWSSPSRSSSLTQHWELQVCSGLAVPYGSLPCWELHVPRDPHDSLLANRAAVNPLIPKQLMKGSWQYSLTKLLFFFFFKTSDAIFY